MKKKATTQVRIAFADIASIYFQVTQDTEGWRRVGGGSLMTLDRKCYAFVKHQFVGDGVLLEVETNEY